MPSVFRCRTTLRSTRALKWTVDFADAENAGMAVTIDLTKPDPPSRRSAAECGVDLIVVVGVNESLDPATAAAQLRALLDAHHYTRGLRVPAPGHADQQHTRRCRRLSRRPIPTAPQASRSSAAHRSSTPASCPGANGIAADARARPTARDRRSTWPRSSMSMAPASTMTRLPQR